MAAAPSGAVAAFEAWMGVVDHPYVIGDFVWTGMDYLGESGIGHTRLDGEPGAFLLPFPWHVSNCGDIDICGCKRPQSYYRDVLWGRGSGTATLTATTDGLAGGKVTVEVGGEGTGPE